MVRLWIAISVVHCIRFLVWYDYLGWGMCLKLVLHAVFLSLDLTFNIYVLSALKEVVDWKSLGIQLQISLSN